MPPTAVVRPITTNMFHPSNTSPNVDPIRLYEHSISTAKEANGKDQGKDFIVDKMYTILLNVDKYTG